MTPGVLVRPAVVEDAPALGTLHMRVWQTAYAGQMPREYLDSLRVETWIERRRTSLDEPRPGSRSLVLEVGGEVAGFSIGGPCRDADEDPRLTGEIFAIYLYPRFWGQGLGRLLQERSIASLAELTRTSVVLWVLESNERARRFYEHTGFALDGARKTIRIGGADLPEVRYRRPLT